MRPVSFIKRRKTAVAYATAAALTAGTALAGCGGGSPSDGARAVAPSSSPAAHDRPPVVSAPPEAVAPARTSHAPIRRPRHAPTRHAPTLRPGRTPHGARA